MENKYNLNKFSYDFYNYKPEIKLANIKIRIRKNYKIGDGHVNGKEKIETKWILDKLNNIFGNLENKEVSNFLINNNESKLNSKFVSNNIKKCISKEIIYNIRLHFCVKIDFLTIGNIDLYFDLYFINSDDINQCIEELNNMIKIYCFFCKYFLKEKNLYLIFYSLNLKKKIDFIKGNILNANNVNSGLSSFSTIYKDENYIMIWRKEEFLKVFIHEIIHYLNLDSKLNSNSNLNLNLNNLVCLNPNTKILPNEAYTDFLAITYHLLILSNGNMETFNKMLKKEIDFIIKQAAKILFYYNFNSWDEFVNKGNCNIYLHQKTSVFSYYILKACMFFNFKYSIDFFKNEKYSIDFFKMKSTVLNHIYWKNT